MARQTRMFLGTTKVFIPWKDTDGMKQWSVLTFKGDANAERLFREVRKFIKHNFRNRVTNEWIMSRCRIWNSEENPAAKPVTKRPTNKQVEEFIQRIQDADEDGADTVSENGNAQEAKEPLPPVPDTN